MRATRRELPGRRADDADEHDPTSGAGRLDPVLTLEFTQSNHRASRQQAEDAVVGAPPKRLIAIWAGDVGMLRSLFFERRQPAARSK